MTTASELADLSADLRPRVQALIAAARQAGHAVGITSAWRSRAEQQRLYDGWKARRPGFNPANPPGMSRHEDTTPDGRPAANACDLDYPNGAVARALAVAWVHTNARTFGLHFPIRREDWHVESNGQPYRPTPAPAREPTTQEDPMTPELRTYLDARFAALEGGPRRPDRTDTNTQTISLADVLTAVERVEKRLTALEARP